jgi:hypothetical protein
MTCKSFNFSKSGMKTGPLQSDSKRKLGALLEKLVTHVKTASGEACEPVFVSLANFARDALLERDRRMARARSPEIILSPLPAVVPKRVREIEAEPQSLLACCIVCSDHYRKGQRCDECDEGFCWCYTGYSRIPREDSLYPSVVKSLRKSLCGDCLQKLQLPEAVLPMQMDVLAVAEVFAAAKWKWVSCLCDGSSMVSVSGAALEGLLFLLLPFYCQQGIGHHPSESRQDPAFLAFVVGCATAALLILAHDSPNSARVQAWQSVIATRELASSFVELEFDHVWNVIANCLTASAPQLRCVFAYGSARRRASSACSVTGPASRRAFDLALLTSFVGIPEPSCTMI